MKNVSQFIAWIFIFTGSFHYATGLYILSDGHMMGYYLGIGGLALKACGLILLVLEWKNAKD
jgi:hypothetical protein